MNMEEIEDRLIKKFVDPRIMAALENDLNTPLAMSILHDLRKSIEKMLKSRNPDQNELWTLKMRLIASMKFMGLGQTLPPMIFC